MSDDPFARAVERAQAAERAEAHSKRARRQEMVGSGARTGFRVHLYVYLAVNLMLVAIWATTTPGYPWFLWPLLGWGVGLVAHYGAVQNYVGRRTPRGHAPQQPTYAAPQPTYAPPTPAPTPAPAPAPTPEPTPRPAPSMASAPSSTSDELTRLHELHQAGVLDADEFRAAKAKLLG